MSSAATVLRHAVLRRLLAAEHPEVWQRQQRDWQAWLELRRARLPDPALVRAHVVVPIPSIADIPLHSGLLQLLGAPGLLALVVLVLPNRSAALLARAEAMAQGWGALVTITTASEWAAAAARLQGLSRVVRFACPAAFGQLPLDWTAAQAWEELAATATPAGTVEIAPTLTSPEPRLPDLAEHLRALAEAPPSDLEAGEATAARALEQAIAKALPRPHSLVIGEARPGDLIAVTTRTSAGTLAVTALRPASLRDKHGAIAAPLPPRFASAGERTLDIHQLPERGMVRIHHVTVETAPSVIEPWMLTAYLNRGGGGNRVVTAFARGAGCALAYAEDELVRRGDEWPTIPVVWGVLRGSAEIVARAKVQDLPFYYIDHAYFDRGHGHSYRITLSRHEAGPVRKCDEDRLRRLEVRIKPWRKSGRAIIVCPPTKYFAVAHGCPNWLEETLYHLRLETDRPIVVRSKPVPGEPFVPLEEAIADAHALVTHSSNVAVEAACLGTPVFVAPTSAAAPIGHTDLTKIEKPRYPDRRPWLAHLAYSQFSLEEFASGTAWSILCDYEERDYV